ncbi:beta-1,3-glucanase family protein, partial [Thalassiella azotivora]
MTRLTRTATRAGTALATAALLALGGLVPAHTAPATQAAVTDLPLTITNDSGRSEQTFVYVLARSQATGQQGYVDAGGTWRPFDLPGSVPPGQPNPPAPDVAIPGPADGASRTITLPPSLVGGRVYVAYGERLRFDLSPGGLVEPASWNSGDPNHDVLFDWAEFTRNGTAIHINTTMVDAFSVPLSVSVTAANGVRRAEGELVEGGRQQVFDAVRALGGDWADLVQTRASDGLPLRVVAPTHGLATSGFDATYFDAYVDDVYTYYADRPLTVDTSLGTFTGTVADGRWTFRRENGAVIGALPRPTTRDVLGCSGAMQPHDQPDLTAILAVGARVCAAFHRGTLSTPSRPGLDRQPTYDASAFYRHPSSNHYAKVMHDATVNGRAYGFAFDDVAEFNPSIDEPNPVSTTLTLTPFDGEGDGGGPGGGSGAVRSGVAGKCLDVSGASSANGTAVQLWPCNGTVAQDWTFGSDGTLRALGKCLDVTEWGTANGSSVQIWDCNP